MIFNSAYYWGIPARILHWLAAVLLLVVFVHGSFVLDDWDEMGHSGRAALAWHAAGGITLGAVMVLRLLWRFANRTPMMPAATSVWERRVAHLAHGALYVLTVLAVLSGWMLAGGVSPPVEVRLFGLVPVPVLMGPAGGRWVNAVLAGLHEGIAVLLVALAGVHALAALWHHFVLGDSVLRRMLLRGRVRHR